MHLSDEALVPHAQADEPNLPKGMKMVDKIATIVGASGFIGRQLVQDLAHDGWRIRAAVRRPAEAEFLRPLGAVGQIEIVQANVRYKSSLVEAFSGADAVVNLAGVLESRGNQSFHAIHALGARHVAEAAVETGAKQLVHVSAIGADANSHSKYAVSKAAGEKAIRDIFPAATLLRPSVIFGSRDQFFNRFAAMAQLSPALPLIGGGKTRMQPVYVGDVARCAAKAIETHEFDGRAFELGGPDVKTFRELMEEMLEIIDRKRLLIPMPFFAASGLGLIGEIAGAVPFVEAPITRDQVKLLRQDNIVGISGDESVGTINDFGLTPEPLAAILPTYLVRYRQAGQFTPEPV